MMNGGGFYFWVSESTDKQNLCVCPYVRICRWLYNDCLAGGGGTLPHLVCNDCYGTNYAS